METITHHPLTFSEAARSVLEVLKGNPLALAAAGALLALCAASCIYSDVRDKRRHEAEEELRRKELGEDDMF